MPGEAERSVRRYVLAFMVVVPALALGWAIIGWVLRPDLLGAPAAFFWITIVASLALLARAVARGRPGAVQFVRLAAVLAVLPAAWFFLLGLIAWEATLVERLSALALLPWCIVVLVLAPKTARELRDQAELSEPPAG